MALSDFVNQILKTREIGVFFSQISWKLEICKTWHFLRFRSFAEISIFFIKTCNFERFSEFHEISKKSPDSGQFLDWLWLCLWLTLIGTVIYQCDIFVRRKCRAVRKGQLMRMPEVKFSPSFISRINIRPLNIKHLKNHPSHFSIRIRTLNFSLLAKLLFFLPFLLFANFREISLRQPQAQRAFLR